MNTPTSTVNPLPTRERGSSLLEGIATALALIGLLAASLAQTACNTTKGVGRDVQSVGRGVERAGSGR